MYALSHQNRPREEGGGDEDRPQVPARHYTSSGVGTRPSARKGSGGIAATIRPSHAEQSYQMKHHLEDEVGVEDSFEDEKPTVSRSNKAGMPRSGSTAVGAVAVEGPSPSTATQRYVSTVNENSYQESFASSTPQAGQEMPETLAQEHPAQEQPIEARCVSDDEADIEAQVQTRMAKEAKDIAKLVHEQLMTNVTVPVNVQPSLQESVSLMTEGRDGSTSIHQQKWKRLCLIVIGILAIVVAVAAGVGVAVSNKKDDPPSLPSTPTPPPDLQAFQELLSPISGDALNDGDSPQLKALSWIANEDLASTTVGSTPDETIKARYVAAVIYYALGGQEWPEKYSFLSEGDICTWNKNGAGGFLFGISCSSDGSVNSLRLVENKLSGSIPLEIGYLSGLTNLDMANNTIAGTLPNSLENLTSLEFLNFTENGLTGTLPEVLYTHPLLTHIRLNKNHLTGTISPSLGTSPTLKVFWVIDNELTGTIPSNVGQSSILETVNFGSNQLSGTIPEFWPSSNIFSMVYYNNSLVGTIPESIGSLPWLEFLSISENKIVGSIPSELGQCQYLGDLYLGNNTQISGTLPTELGSLRFLEILYLENSQVAGSIPTEVGSLSSLQYLYLNDNRLTGIIPTELGQCQNLASVDFDANYLRGDIGPLIESLPRGLESFDIGGNGLQGTIPASIGEFAFLGFFDVRSNNLNGTIPSEFGSLSMMTTLDLGANAFVGTVPVTLASLPNLGILSFYGNDLTGDLTEFCNIVIQTGSIELLAANTCGATEEMECPCCNQCCSIDIFECRATV